MTYLVILLFAVMAISIKACGVWMLFFVGLTWCEVCGCLWVRRENGNNE
ncbi:MAG: hypothetical protein IJA00_08490 [Bacteroidaceae bacterium]|nr:hypothetical protein [Bacteroidaceae bacterium]